MAASARNTLKLLHEKLLKEYKANAVLLPKDREILEHLVYAAFLENTPFPVALQAFETLEDYFIDWNELRVSTTAEMVDILGMLPFPQRTCERIRQTLQWIFQTTYKFDLEEWRKKDAKSVRDYLVSIPFVTRFMADYIVRSLYGQNVVPLDEGGMRVMRLLDLVDIDSENKEIVKGMDRAFSRQDSEEFFLLIHQLSAAFMKDGLSKPILKLLKSIDSDVDQRSFIPLVESDDEKDPSQIARSMAAKQVRRPAHFEIDESELLEETDDLDFIEGTDDGLEENPAPYESEEIEEEFYVSKTEIKERPQGSGKEPKTKKKLAALSEDGDESEKSRAGRKPRSNSSESLGGKKEKTVSADMNDRAAHKEKSKKDSGKEKESHRDKGSENRSGAGKTAVLLKEKKGDRSPQETGSVSKIKKERKPDSSGSKNNVRPPVQSDKGKGGTKDRSARKQDAVAKSRTPERKSGPPPEKSKISVIKKTPADKKSLTDGSKVSKTNKLKQKKPR